MSSKKQDAALQAFLADPTMQVYGKYTRIVEYFKATFPVLAEASPVVLRIGDLRKTVMGKEKAPIFGAFYPNKFQKDGEQISELVISAQHNNRPLQEIAADMAFRLLTAVQLARYGVKGKTYNPNYVGSEMATLAKEIGLQTHSSKDASESTGQRCYVSVIPAGVFAQAFELMPADLKDLFRHIGYESGTARKTKIIPSNLGMQLADKETVKITAKWDDVPELFARGFALTSKSEETLIQYVEKATADKQAIVTWAAEQYAIIKGREHVTETDTAETVAEKAA